MGVKIINQNLSKISEHKFVRSDFKYRDEERTFLKNKKGVFPLKNAFNFVNGVCCTEFYSEEKTELPFIRISNLSFKYDIDDDDMIYIDEGYRCDENKLLKKDDIVYAAIGTVGKLNLAKEYEGGIFSNNTTVLRKKNENINTKFYEKLLQTNYYQNHLKRIVSWKAQPNLQQYDMELLKIPSIPANIQDEIVEKIEPIEKKIKQLQSTITPIKEVIDGVFTRELGFDKVEFLRQRNISEFTTNISDFGKNRDLRNSCKFHRPSAHMLQDFLNKKTNLKLKHFLKEDIVLGAGISPKDFDESGTAYYVSMATIKTYEIKLDDTQLVSEEYYASNKGKNVLKNDIIVARSGVAIGKTAIAENDFDGVFADFTMRIRINPDKCIPLFAYYYIRSKFFQYLIEVHKKGLQNQNIFPAQIQEFSFPNFSLSDQERIVEEIQTEIDKQNEIREQIQQERSKIDEIVESIIRN